MLKPLADLIARLRGQRTTNTAAYDLSQLQLSQLVNLRTYDEWASLLAMLDNLSTYKAEALIYEHDPAKNAFLRGYIAALRETPLLLERLAIQTTDARERANAAGQSPTDATAAKRRASLYATPSWPA